MKLKERTMKKIVFLILTVAACGSVFADEAAGKTKKVDPDREILQAAIKAHNNKDYEKAIGLWRQIENKEESKLWENAVFKIGKTLKEQGKYDEAIKQFEKLYAFDINAPIDKNKLRMNNTKSDGKIQTAICWMYHGNYQNALKSLKFAEEVYPYWYWCGTSKALMKSMNPMYQGICYENLKNYNMAMRYYLRTAFDESYLSTFVSNRIFYLYQSQGQLDNLKKILDQVDKELTQRHIDKHGKESVEKESFKKCLPTVMIQQMLNNRKYYAKSGILLFKGKYYEKLLDIMDINPLPFPEKVELPGSLEEITGKNIKHKPLDINTREIILLLGCAKIEVISTSHSQDIYIQLKDGSYFRGKYVHAEADKYSSDKKLFDILNLVTHVQKNIRPKYAKDWKILME